MTTQAIDQAKAEAFGGQMIGILNGGALALMLTSVAGHDLRRVVHRPRHYPPQ